MHASFTQVFSSHVMGCVPLVRLSRPFATRVNPSRGHLWPFQSARTFSTRITSRIPVNLSRLAHPVRHLWGQQQPRARLPPQTFADEQEEAIKANLLETAYRGGQPGDMMLRCTILDVGGNVKTISGQFKKSDLCAEHRLNPRDLRKFDSRIPNLVPTLFVRQEAILVNILHIRALVKSDAVLLFDTYGSVNSKLQSSFLYHLEHNLKAKGTGLPYEFRALESILQSVLSALDTEIGFLRQLVGNLLAELDDDIDRDKFMRLLHRSRKLTSFQNRAKLVQEALEEVSEQDEDLVAMYLTDKKNGIQREPNDHQELEILLESFAKQVEEIVNETETTQSNIQSTQEIVELILDSNRNALLTLDLKISIITMGLGVGTLIAGLFGMNLRSHFEEHSYAFFVTSGVSLAFVVVISMYAVRRLRRIRKVGPLSDGKSTPARRPWMPLPLRRRTPNNWL